MELKQIKDLMSAMGRTGTKKVFLKKDGFELTLERDDTAAILRDSGLSPESDEENPMRADMEQHRAQAFLKGASGKIPPANGAAAAPPAPAMEEVKGQFIVSPMVGTFYASAAPEDPPYVKVGDRVDRNSVVCIVEAMKVMNEVKAGLSGTVAEIYIDNGQPIEFGTKLFRITTE